jgi:hypothetical protein
VRDVVVAVVASSSCSRPPAWPEALRGYRLRRVPSRFRTRVGRTIIAEIPAGDDLVLVSTDPVRFHYGEQSIDKDRSSPFGCRTDRRRRLHLTSPSRSSDASADQLRRSSEGIRDRWDVAVETVVTTLIECGSIRERVSQSWRAKSSMRSNRTSSGGTAWRDHHSVSGTPR